MSYDEHLISQAGGDGDVIGAVTEYVRQRRLLSKDLGPVVHGVFSDPDAEMADLKVTHLEALLALVREQAAKLEAVRAELHHAADNGHILSGDCQGAGPGERIPAVRVSYIRAAMGGS